MTKAFRDLIIITLITVIGFSLAYMYLLGRGRLTNTYEDVVDPLGSQFFVIQRVKDIPELLNSNISEITTPPNVALAYFIQIPDQGWDNSLETVLLYLKNTATPPATFISITAYVKGMENKIVEKLKNFSEVRQVFFHSPHENVAREIHRELPKTTLVISRAEASRIYLMSKLRLEALPRLEGQIFWADFLKEEDSFSQNLLSELKKRRVPALFGPTNNEAQWQKMLDLKVSGIITDNAPDLIRWLKTRQKQ